VGLFMAGSTLLGAVIARGAPRSLVTGLLLTTSMRDFAIAAGIATAAFGPTSAAPLGLYGVPRHRLGHRVGHRPAWPRAAWLAAG
jgi:hypothetical protein